MCCIFLKKNPEYLPQYEYPNKFNNYFNEFRKRKLYLCSLRLFVKTGGVWGGGEWGCIHLNIKFMPILGIEMGYSASDNASFIFFQLDDTPCKHRN